MSGRTSVTNIRSPTIIHWAEKSFKMAEITYSPYSPRAHRPTSTTPCQIDVDDVASMVSRLSRPNTSTARKAVLWSQPRREYEFNYEMSSNLRNPRHYWKQFPQLAKHYPGTWRVADRCELKGIISRLTVKTVASQARKEDCISRRRVIEKAREDAIKADIVYQQNLKEQSRRQRAAALHASTAGGSDPQSDAMTEFGGDSAQH